MQEISKETNVKWMDEFFQEVDDFYAKQPAKSTGTKHDNNKPRMELIDSEFLEGLAQVLTKGAEKYADHNWRGGITTGRLIAAAYRHLGKINNGEDLDPEWNLPHVYHLACCVMFLSWMMKHRPDLDNRWKDVNSSSK